MWSSGISTPKEDATGPERMPQKPPTRFPVAETSIQPKTLCRKALFREDLRHYFLTNRLPLSQAEFECGFLPRKRGTRWLTRDAERESSRRFCVYHVPSNVYAKRAAHQKILGSNRSTRHQTQQ